MATTRRVQSTLFTRISLNRIKRQVKLLAYAPGLLSTIVVPVMLQAIRRRGGSGRCAGCAEGHNVAKASPIPPEAFDAKGDNIAAVIFVNDVDGDGFREIVQISGR